MALTRKLLSALGVEPEKIDEIITAHTETVDALKTQVNGLKQQVAGYDELKTKYDAVKASEGGKDSYHAKYDELKQQFDEYKAQQEAQLLERRKQEAYRGLLHQAGVPDKRLDLVLRVSDLSKLTFDKDGNLENQDELMQKIRNDWSDFIPSDQTGGAQTGNPPVDPASNGAKTMTKKEIVAIKDATERQKAIADNHELFGF